MMDRIFDIIVIVLFAGCVLWGAKKKYTDSKQELCKRLNSLRGIFAIEIVVGHVIRYEQTLLYPLGKFMIISVAYFFFVSAFGMSLAYQSKGKQYLKGFIKRKVLYLFLIAVAIYCVNMLWDFATPFRLGYISDSTNIGKTFFEMTNWYIWEQIIFYVLFYLLYKYLRNYRILVMVIITIIGSTMFFVCGWIQGWYSSSLAFPLGLLFGEYFETCMNFLRKWYGKVLVFLFILLGLSSLLLPAESLIGMVYLRNIMCIAALLLLIYFSVYFTCGNKISRFMGRYSTEIFVSQFVFLRIFEAIGLEYKRRIILVLLATILMSLLLKPFFDRMKKVCSK